jgi:hypothetical protein
MKFSVTIDRGEDGAVIAASRARNETSIRCFFGVAGEVLQQFGAAESGGEVRDSGFNSSNRGVRDPFARWCGRESP